MTAAPADPGLGRAEMIALLRWYADAGVEDAVGEGAAPLSGPRPIGRAAPVPTAAHVAGPAVAPGPAESASTPPPATGESPVPRAVPAQPAPTLPGRADATVEARRVAAACTSLEELRAALAAFEGCALRLTATQMVFADGAPDAAVMIVGEAPGAEEDRLGKPFVGQSGKLLDRMLAAIGLDRSRVYISNIVNWRPPGNRQPNAGEIAISLPFIERHIALKRPRLLLTAGGTATAALLGTKEGITRIHGRWFDRSIEGLDQPVPLMPIYHPAFLLRQASMKRDVWRDLLTLRRRMIEMGLLSP